MLAANNCPLADVGEFHVPSARTSAQQRTDAKCKEQKLNRKYSA